MRICAAVLVPMPGIDIKMCVCGTSVILDGIQQAIDDFLGVSCFVLLRERDQACAPHSFDFCGATIFGQHVQHPPSVDILATKYAFEFGIGSDKGGANLIDQPGVGPGEFFIDTVEYF